MILYATLAALGTFWLLNSGSASAAPGSGSASTGYAGALPFIDKVPSSQRVAFEMKVRSLAAELGCRPEELMAIMHFESGGTLSPSVQNSFGYTGLIQFGTSAAAMLNTTTAALKAMTHIQQMDYVAAYFRAAKKSNPGFPKLGFIDLYFAVFYPKWIPRGMDEILPAGDTLKKNNPALVHNGVVMKRYILNDYIKRYPFLANGNSGGLWGL